MCTIIQQRKSLSFQPLPCFFFIFNIKVTVLRLTIHCTSSQSCSLLFKNLVVQPSSQHNTLFLLVRLPIFWDGISASIETSAIISCPLKSGSHFPRLKIMICSGRGNWKWQWKRFLLSPFSLSLQRKQKYWLILRNYTYGKSGSIWKLTVQAAQNVTSLHLQCQF